MWHVGKCFYIIWNTYSDQTKLFVWVSSVTAFTRSLDAHTDKYTHFGGKNFPTKLFRKWIHRIKCINLTFYLQWNVPFHHFSSCIPKSDKALTGFKREKKEYIYFILYLIAWCTCLPMLNSWPFFWQCCCCFWYFFFHVESVFSIQWSINRSGSIFSASFPPTFQPIFDPSL